MTQTSTRLSDNIIPKHYLLSLEPELEKSKYHGKVSIELRILNPTNKIVLHSKEIEIIHAEIMYKNTSKKLIVKLNKEEETLTLSLKEKIPKTYATLLIEFIGNIDESLGGLYQSKYVENGVTNYLLTTQFEATECRKCFPCFDEPNKKATFTVNLIIDKALEAVSNMPIEKEIVNENKKEVTFIKSPIMSTYLLYLGIGKFEFLESDYNNVHLRVVSRPGKSKEGAYALDLTKKFLAYFEKYSEVPYPLPKLDLIAVPDFAAAAMENWGAITFREVVLLVDEQKTTRRMKERIAEVLAHELWHQWSGNLVTMDWWNDLWLNESFATYMAYKAMNEIMPEWNIWEKFVFETTNPALSKDALKNTHPIAVKVNNPSEIDEIFDEISYGKGGSVLRMLDVYVGEETFRKGVSAYLKENAYSNATAKKLWVCIERVAKNNSDKMIQEWITKPGYPELTIIEKGNKTVITQKRINNGKSQTWRMPLVALSTNGIIKKEWATKKIELVEKIEYFNPAQTTFCRIKYDEKIIKTLKEKISKKLIPSINRASIENDLYALAKYGQSSILTYLDILEAYSEETEGTILASISGHIYAIYTFFGNEPLWPLLEEKIRKSIRKPFLVVHERLGFNPIEGESQNDALLRSIAIGALGLMKDRTLITEVIERVRNKNIHPEIEGVAFTLLARYGNMSDYALLKDIYVSSDGERKVKALSALYRTGDNLLAKESLVFALSKEVRTQDLRTIWGTMSINPVYEELLLPWVQKEWPIIKKYETVRHLWTDIIESLITSHTGKKNKLKLKLFLAKNVKGYDKTKKESFEILDINTSFIEKNKKILEKYCKNH